MNLPLKASFGLDLDSHAVCFSLLITDNLRKSVFCVYYTVVILEKMIEGKKAKT